MFYTFSSGLYIAQVSFLFIFCQSVNCMSLAFDFGDVKKLKH